MPQIPSNVNPGDLITAFVFNSTFAVLADHEARLQKLEALIGTASGVSITQVVPTSVSPGQTLQLIGTNFGNVSLVGITISGVQVPAANFNAQQSTNTLLTFTVPTIVGIPQGGMSAPIQLVNPSGSATATVLLLPAQQALPQGVIQVAESQVSQNTAVTAGQNIVITFTVTGTTSQNETYNITPTVDAGWAAQLVDSSHNPIVPAQITIPGSNQGVNTPFLVQVSIPNGLANGTVGNVNVKVASVLNPQGLKTSTGQPYALTVGSPPPGAQNNIIVQMTGAIAPAVVGNNGAVSVPTGSTGGGATFQVTFKNPDTYQIAAPTFANSAGWTAVLRGGPNFTTTSSGTNENFSVQLIPTAGATATTLNITISSTTNAAITSQLQVAVQPA